MVCSACWAAQKSLRKTCFYLTVMNQNHAQPSMPPGVQAGVLRGLYRLPTAPGAAALSAPVARCTLLGSGAILHEVLEAERWLAEHWNVAAQVCSATSFSELARDGMACERWRALGQSADTAWATQVLSTTPGPIVAATDYVRAVPEQLRAWVPAGRRYVTLGTDGFGRSDGRTQLRDFFEVSARHIVLRALQALADDGLLAPDLPAAARQRYGITANPHPWTI